MQVLDAAVNGSVLSTDYTGSGDYFVMNLRAYLNSLGITVDTSSAPASEPSEDDETEDADPDIYNDGQAPDEGTNEVSREWYEENYILVDS